MYLLVENGQRPKATSEGERFIRSSYVARGTDSERERGGTAHRIDRYAHRARYGWLPIPLTPALVGRGRAL